MEKRFSTLLHLPKGRVWGHLPQGKISPGSSSILGRGDNYHWSQHWLKSSTSYRNNPHPPLVSSIYLPFCNLLHPTSSKPFSFVLSLLHRFLSSFVNMVHKPLDLKASLGFLFHFCEAPTCIWKKPSSSVNKSFFNSICMSPLRT